MSDAYAKVATVIGDEMDKAWERIMGRLADANMSALSTGGASATTVEDLKVFFQQLGGAKMDLQFCSNIPKGEAMVCRAHEIRPSTGSPIGMLGVEGSISIGVNIKF
jgi:hypothetical protein